MSKKITILTIGSRGDVQPYLALGLGLQKAGYQVCLATAAQYAPFVAAYGLDFTPISGEFLEIGQTENGRLALAGKKDLGLVKRVLPLLRKMLDDCWPAVQGSQGLVYHPKTLAGPHLAEKLGIPVALAIPVPAFSPTGDFPNPLLYPRGLGRPLNRLTYPLMDWASSAPYRGIVNAWRTETLGLAATGSENTAQAAQMIRLYPVSPRLVARPADWDASSHLTGFWFLDHPRGWAPPAELAGFLADGPAPVYIGFGSMPSVDPAGFTQMILEAVRLAGVRAVLSCGVGGIQKVDAGPQVCFIDHVPHDWLFPRVAAVVHHGGAGTTAAAIHAGKPSLICPFFGDQSFWGQRVFAAGAGLASIPQKRLSVENLAAALRRLVSDVALAGRCRELAAAIEAEDGVGAAVEILAPLFG